MPLSDVTSGSTHSTPLLSAQRGHMSRTRGSEIIGRLLRNSLLFLLMMILLRLQLMMILVVCYYAALLLLPLHWQSWEMGEGGADKIEPLSSQWRHYLHLWILWFFKIKTLYTWNTEICVFLSTSDLKINLLVTKFYFFLLYANSALVRNSILDKKFLIFAQSDNNFLVINKQPNLRIL